MKFKTIGGEGVESLEVSVVGLGCNAFGARCDQAQTAAIVDAAITAGINFFDTSNSYSDGLSEDYIGKALGARRAECVVEHLGVSPAVTACNPSENPYGSSCSPRTIDSAANVPSVMY